MSGAGLSGTGHSGGAGTFGGTGGTGATMGGTGGSAQLAWTASGTGSTLAEQKKATKLDLTGSSRAASSLGRGVTLHQLHQGYSDAQSESIYTSQQSETYSESEDYEDYQDLVIVTRHLNNYPRYGYVLCALYVALCCTVTYSITIGWSKAQLRSFWYTMIVAALADLFIVEWCYLGLTWLYRWMTGDTASSASEIHPYEGEEVVREW